MKFTKLIKAVNIDKKLKSLIKNNLWYASYNMEEQKMDKPSALLEKYEEMYEGIRPKSIEYDDNFIEYVSQYCTDSNAMFDMLYEVISKDPTLKKMFDEGDFEIRVCSRDNWGDWDTFSNKKGNK